jgi:hypothetical protein
VISNAPSSINDSTTESFYDSNYDFERNKELSFTSDKDISIKQLQRQQEELMRMQAIIQEKMSNIQSAIHMHVSQDDVEAPQSNPKIMKLHKQFRSRENRAHFARKS